MKRVKKLLATVMSVVALSIPVQENASVTVYAQESNNKQGIVYINTDLDIDLNLNLSDNTQYPNDFKENKEKPLTAVEETTRELTLLIILAGVITLIYFLFKCIINSGKGKNIK